MVRDISVRACRAAIVRASARHHTVAIRAAFRNLRNGGLRLAPYDIAVIVTQLNESDL
jgi:hypothetical protein